MSYKRSRAEYEADLQKQQSPFVVYGTPLPPLDSEARDDGSYVPVWKQEVRDERGRKRLHGAFTGGWSAGYFNTVGSKEGWTPSTFVSSRTNRAKDKDNKDNKAAPQQRLEDFMDEEDLADAEEARRIQTSQAFAGLGASDNDVSRAGGLAGLFHIQGETMGTKLLKKMGWREGQGVGPKIRRKADLDMGTKPGSGDASDTYLFAPENAAMIGFIRKTDRKGLGYEGGSKLAPLASSRSGQQSDDDDSEDDGGFSLGRPKFLGSTGSKKKDSTTARGGIGIGVLNDTGSDDEDPYEVGPRISYNKILGGNKKKKKKESGLSASINPAVKSIPKFVPKRTAAVKAALGIRKCHDGRPPLQGFVLGQEPDPLISMINADGRYPPPEIPPDWKSRKKPEATPVSSQYASTADAAKASQLDPTSRAALLGEKQLPGKSVFDFLTSSARDRLAEATGKTNLPQAKGEIPAGYALSEEEKRRSLLDRIPKLDKQSAVGAMARGASGSGPYGDNDDKRSRYRAYLELQAGIRSEPLPRPAKMTADDWIQEMHEFFNVARIFRPMTGSMASRFTTSTSTSSSMATGSSDGKDGDVSLLFKPPTKPEDPAEQAARMGMFGHMTRSSKDFYPSRLLCKRFNVKPPAHVQAERNTDTKRGAQTRPSDSKPMTMTMIQDVPAVSVPGGGAPRGNNHQAPPPADQPRKEEDVVVVDTTRNDALEGKRAGEEVFKAIFGDSSDDEDS
ncbi:G patch domain-containing protein 1 [Cytospora mali]|uniref:G patch domain-containing protein 1 n=1 Tax=Cytospora mali TaxID=578113 RepID=A0A194UPG5_CYTMA|nr:G patch domain-containing protein 1 [Valsa mali var. pyri (nom. inval.)]